MAGGDRCIVENSLLERVSLGSLCARRFHHVLLLCEGHVQWPVEIDASSEALSLSLGPFYAR